MMPTRVASSRESNGRRPLVSLARSGLTRGDQQLGETIVTSLDVVTGVTTEILRIAKPAQIGNLLLWTPDGRSILFAKTDRSNPSLWVVPAGGGQAKIGRPGAHAVVCVDADASRGRRIAYHTGRTATEVWRLDNFLPSAPVKSSRR